MCGRYALALSNEEVYDGLQNQLPRLFQGGRPRWEREEDYRPGNYNVAPRQRMPIVHRDPEDSDRVVLHTAQWGLIPHWTKHPPTTPLNTINARSESLIEPGSGGMWHALKGYKRCIVPAQGYYEWLKRPSAKIAHFARLPHPESTETSPLMFIAGLYDTVKYTSPAESHFTPSGPEDKRIPYPTGNPIPLTTYTILTTAPAKDLSWLHDRMPCLLMNWEDIERWLDLGEVKGWEEGKGGTGEILGAVSGLESYPVPPEVGKVGTNSPTYIQPVSERADGIKSFFAKQSPAKPKSIPFATTPKSGKSEIKGERTDSSSTSAKKKGKEVKEEEEDDKPHLTTVIRDGVKEDKEVGLGDDSNAPNPVIEEEDEKLDLKKENSTPGKRKRADVEDDSEGKKEKPKRAGHQIEVVRRKEEEGDKTQPSITNFFAAPSTSKADTGAGSKTGRGVKTRASTKKTKK